MNPKERIYSPPRLASSLLLHNGAGRNRTADTCSFNALLYRLSYQPFESFYRICSSQIERDGPTGLEPVISCVTGRRPNQLDHGTRLIAGAGFEPATFGL